MTIQHAPKGAIRSENGDTANNSLGATNGMSRRYPAEFPRKYKSILRGGETGEATPEDFFKNKATLREHKLQLHVSKKDLMVPNAILEENISTLESNHIPLDWSVAILLANPAYVKENIELFIAHKVPFTKSSVRALGSLPAYVDKNIWALEEQEMVPSEFRRLSFLGLPPEEFEIKLSGISEQKRVMYSFSDKKFEQFKNSRDCFLFRIDDLAPVEQRAFWKVLEILDDPGKISKKDIENIYNGYVNPMYPTRLNTILRNLVDEGILNKNSPPKKESERKVHQKTVETFALLDEAIFTSLLGDLKINERKAFHEICEKLEKGNVTRKEIRKIFNDTIKSSDPRARDEALTNRLNRLLVRFVARGALEKYEETIEKAQAANA